MFERALNMSLNELGLAILEMKMKLAKCVMKKLKRMAINMPCFFLAIVVRKKFIYF